jgi:hypothetical protein
MQTANYRLAALIRIVLVLSLVSTIIPAKAEVSAEVDDTGVYSSLVLKTRVTAKKSRIWSVQKGAAGRNIPLNQDGDAMRDSLPVFVEDHTNRNYPHLVWSRFNGHDFDLVWSDWTATGWNLPKWVEWDTRPGNDLDPGLTIGDDGRLFLVWWNDENGVGKVYFSFFLQTRWSPPTLISDWEVHSHHPGVEILDDSRIQVNYQTPDGMISEIILLIRPNTITDDIDPVDHLSTEPLNLYEIDPADDTEEQYREDQSS